VIDTAGRDGTSGAVGGEEGAQSSEAEAREHANEQHDLLNMSSKEHAKRTRNGHGTDTHRQHERF
jgi:hypothetical protein